jgi:uncharacterized protein (TIGR03083 family)
MNNNIKIETIHLFEKLDALLIELLKSLSAAEWQAPTVAKHWKVKDVVSHLLDGSLRGLSISRDGYYGAPPEKINNYEMLVAYLNKLNSDWITATKRLSPQILIELLEITNKHYTQHLQQQNPDTDAVFSVAWAGQKVSANWFHIAREYTEKFLHQQQIRDAVNKQGIMTRELYYPFIDTFMYALPHTFKDISAAEGTTVSVIVTTEIGGQWNIVKTKEGWVLHKNAVYNTAATLTINPHTAWKLFSKSWKPEQVIDTIDITGNHALAKQALKMVAVMA